MKVRAKVWLEEDGSPVFGPGRADLLAAVEREGSIQSAARKVGMSYRHAWSMLKASERRCGRPLIETRRGGRSGGGATLTDFGRSMMQLYAELSDHLQMMLEEMQDDMADAGL